MYSTKENLKTQYTLIRKTDQTITYNVPLWKFWKRKRYLIAILAFIGNLHLFALRININLAIVDMTQLKNVTLENGTIIEKREFDWDSKMQGYVLSSFFYGYTTTQIVGGYLGTRLGGGKVYGTGIAIAALFALITPWAAKTNIYLLIFIRTVGGFLEGICIPSLMNLWVNWAPPFEKARLVTFVNSGAYAGNFLTLPLSSLLATAFGWEIIFYTFGGTAILWYIIWLLIVKNTPVEDKRIHPEELKYITESKKLIKPDETLTIPWCKILTSKPVWAISLLYLCEAWGIHTLTAFMPQMMKSVLNFDLNQTGIISALPYIGMVITIQAGGHLADFMLKRQCMNTTTVRKTVIVIGFAFQAIFLLAASFWISQILTPTFIVLGSMLAGFAVSGIMTNPLDIAPKYASIICGINNTFGSISGILNPIVTGYIVTDMANVVQWRIVYYITSGIYLFGVIISILFVSGELQSWARD